MVADEKNIADRMQELPLENEPDFLMEGEKPYGIQHRCFYFSKEIVFFIKESKYERIYHSLFDQLLRSATSIGANIIEGKAGNTKRDWKNYSVVALKSANETKYWLCLIKDTLEVNKSRLDKLLKEADEISKIIASIIISANH